MRSAIARPPAPRAAVTARISVVIPCRNGAEFLGEALESVRAQTLQPDEVIVVDDRSTDSTAALARAYGATVLRTTEPGGTAVARNVGWRHAQGELIAFLDADDRWRPRHLELVSALLVQQPRAVLAFGSIEFFGILNGRYPNHVAANSEPVDARAFASAMCPVPQMTVIIPKRELEALGGYDETLKAVEDFDLFARLAHRGPFVGCHEITGEYRQHAQQTTRFRRRQVVMEYVLVSERSVNALRGMLPAAEIGRLDAQLLRYWNGMLGDVWRNGDGEVLDMLLSMTDHVPGSAEDARRWRLRRTFVWPVWNLVLRAGRLLKLRQIWNAARDTVRGRDRDAAP